MFDRSCHFLRIAVAARASRAASLGVGFRRWIAVAAGLSPLCLSYRDPLNSEELCDLARGSSQTVKPCPVRNLFCSEAVAVAPGGDEVTRKETTYYVLGLDVQCWTSYFL